MSLLASKFDIQSVETPLAVAAVAQVFDIAVAGTVYTDGASGAGDFSGGTPLSGSTVINPGSIVAIGSDGKAALATAPDLWVATTGTAEVANSLVRKGTGSAPNQSPVPALLPWVVIDGNTDFSGKFVRRVTALHGGMTILTDQVDTGPGSFTPGAPVTFVAGKITAQLGTSKLKQTLGFVGPLGLDSNNVLQVIIPQGAGL